jgi:hypothetical protein
MPDMVNDAAPSASHSEAKCDYTKTRPYAWIDLLTKVLSALALAVLGLAGWLLQSRAEDSRQLLETRDRAERKYLPALRSLSELELILAESVSALPTSWGSESSPSPRLEVFGRQLSYVAYSVFLPDGDLAVAVHPPNYDNELEWRSVPVRAGTLMFAELLRAQNILAPMPLASNVQLVPDRRVLRFPDGSEYLVTAASMAALQAWLGRDRIAVRDLLGPRNIFIAEDLRRGVAERIHGIVMSHQDLGDRYVVIRSEVFRQQADILAPFRRLAQSEQLANHGLEPILPALTVRRGGLTRTR